MNEIKENPGSNLVYRKITFLKGAYEWYIINIMDYPKKWHGLIFYTCLSY